VIDQASSPRVRFAPSPTGYFHVGGAATALTNWVVARQAGGTFILRIEDTDRERGDASWTAGILGSMEWLGIGWDEGPYYQSERSALYADAATRLIASRHAYYCDCTRPAIDERMRGAATSGYDGFCRERALGPGEGRALRFRTPDLGETTVSDVVRGDVVFPNDAIEDFVIVKSNGDPIFVLANVVDDQAMGITHVIRGEEHLPTTPKAVCIWRALSELPLPIYAHLPLLVNEKRQKLSKRRDRVAVEDYRDAGYLPEAMVNYLAVLGWSPGVDQEILTIDEVVARFRLDQVSKSPAFFDEKRLLHFNGVYIRALPPASFVTRAMAFLERTGTRSAHFDEAVFTTIAPLVQERVGTLAEVHDLVAFLFDDPFVVDEESYAKAIGRDDDAVTILRDVAAALATGPYDAPAVRAAVEGAGERLGRKLSKTQGPVRVATMGRTAGLPLFESLELLGRDRTLARLSAAAERRDQGR
jgi:glutamyl-tRNA synthetase